MDLNVQEVIEIKTREVESNGKVYRIFKRGIDIICALFGCILLLPLTIGIWLANIFVKDNGPVFYVQKRIGKNGKEFNLYKYRTMCNNAQEMVKDKETMKKYFSEEQIKEWDENCKIEDDPRITKVGKFLRKTSLDEIPQLLNILKGDISIIGPRPIVQEELEKYNWNKEKLLGIKPGLTGYWAANGRSTTTYEERIQMELYYVDNVSFIMDLKIFLKTIIIVLKKEGAK